ncbi:chemotaxis-specific protein-glutamate methyltransferase CheB [Minwuia thermotolerans]|uniref:Protein-glutamate methylesterase/protein-glutamine glutaminase n=1 Tax=Minwuia thermotolerans TaxID=2056226 RepID=A0A2M9G2G1_9PROT|nr:chemotaxis-specific protein-glutamate methyltransferase CheB [Minwuia thermotolerans]PJK29880.1 chemotaxis response regulator protein-glutamate methylesterase [Minwuia thermotolerans]
MAGVTTELAPPRSDGAGGLHVLVVDDSVFARAMIAKWVEEARLGTVATAADGEQALKKLAVFPADVVTLDLEMPVLSGYEAVPRILAMRPDIRIVVVSGQSEAAARKTFRALDLGAVDFVSKPGPGDKDAFRHQIVERVRALGERHGSRQARDAAAVLPSSAPAVAKPPVRVPEPRGERPAILAIGASTGGPDALARLLKAIGPRINVPVVLCQHMPAKFTSILAANLTRQTGLECREGEDGEQLLPGRVYVAPGDRHMLVRRKGATHHIHLSSDPPEHFCRPSVDPMFRSLAEAYGPRVLALVLTGMGTDGAKGAAALSAAGASIAVQDEESSVVWGMPGAVVKAGVATTVLPVEALAELVRKSCVA